MTSFEDIPDELILSMCESWDTPTLLNMSEAYSRVYQVCSKVVDRRKYNSIISKIKSRTDPYHFITPVIVNDRNIGLIPHIKGGRVYNIYKNTSSMIYLPKLNLIATKENLQKYLASEGLNEEQIEFEISQSDNSWKKKI